MLFGYVLILLSGVSVVSALIKCYPVNDRTCFYTDRSLLSWNEAREFCARRDSTLPIITDKNIDDVFQQFILDHNIVEVNGSDTEQTKINVWLDAHAGLVDDSVQWHWINGKPSGMETSYLKVVGNYSYAWCASISSLYNTIYEEFQGQVYLHQRRWMERLHYICQYHSITPADANCTSEWDQYNNTFSHGAKPHFRASNLTECQKACEFDPRCVSADWHSLHRRCWINTNANHVHYIPKSGDFSEHDDRYAAHYELRRRCNVASTETSCDGGLVYNSTCYKIHRDEKVSWFTAVNRCLSNNGSLAVFDDHILTYFAASLLTQGPLWIGLIKSWWTWPDLAGGADLLYNKFDVSTTTAPKNPPDIPDANYSCAVATTNYWRLSRCTEMHRVVCQSVSPITSAQTVPTVSTTVTTGDKESKDSALPVAALVGVVVAAVIVVVVLIVVVGILIVFMHRRRRSRRQQNHERRDVPTGQTSISSTPDWITAASRPDVVYAHIGHGDNGQYADTTPNEDSRPAQAVIYSELQSKDPVDHIVALSGDLYAQIPKR